MNYTKEQYEKIKDSLMLNDELSQILEMKIKHYSIIEMSFKLNMSERTISRRIKTLKDKMELLSGK